MATDHERAQLDQEQKRLQRLQAGEADYKYRREDETVGEAVAREVKWNFRGADNLARGLDAVAAKDWEFVACGDTPEGFLLRLALKDSAVLPRIRETDSGRVLDWRASGDTLGLIDTMRANYGRVLSLVEVIVGGKDVIGDMVLSFREAEIKQDALVTARRKVSAEFQEHIDPSKLSGPANVRDINVVKPELIGTELGLIDGGINYGARLSALIDLGVMVRMCRTNLEELRSMTGHKGQNDVNEFRKRMLEQRQETMRLYEAVAGVNEAAGWLRQLVSMETDIGGVSKVFVGQEPAIPSHLLRFLSLSKPLSRATTIAMSEILRLTYVGGTSSTLSSPGFGVESKGWEGALPTLKGYSMDDRVRFFTDWERVVAQTLENEGIADSVQLAEHAVDFSVLLTEIFTLGQMAYKRDRRTGKKIGDEGGNGSWFEHGSDPTDKLHQMRDRKQGEAEKGRKAPRPLVAKGVAQELLFSLFQYTEAKKNGDGLGVSVLEALCEQTRGYDVSDFVTNLGAGSHFYFMLFAFRAVQIAEKLEDLPSGRINVAQELGGGPEKLVQEMIDTLLGLHKAWQTLPYAKDGVFTFDVSGATKEEKKVAKDLRDRDKTIEIQRNMVNLLSDFYRAATVGAAGLGGYEDNPDWRGIIDILPRKVYERVVAYTNVMTPQQFWLAIEMAKKNTVGNVGGVLTEEMVEKSQFLKDILVQSSENSEDSLINVVKVFGISGTAENEGEMRKAINALVDKSAEDVTSNDIFVKKTLLEPAKRANPALGKSVVKSR